MTTDTNLDPMAQTCDDIDTSYPILPASNYMMNVKDAVVELNSKGTGNNLTLSWETTDVQTSTKGDQLPAGLVVVKHRISLTPTEKYHPRDIAKNVARVVKALGLGKKYTPAQVQADPSVLKGNKAVVKIGIQKETEEFNEGNTVKGVVIEG